MSRKVVRPISCCRRCSYGDFELCTGKHDARLTSVVDRWRLLSVAEVDLRSGTDKPPVCVVAYCSIVVVVVFQLIRPQCDVHAQ